MFLYIYHNYIMINILYITCYFNYKNNKKNLLLFLSNPYIIIFTLPFENNSESLVVPYIKLYTLEVHLLPFGPPFIGFLSNW